VSQPASTIPVAHLITGLLIGGAEVQLARLLTVMPREAFPALVISLMPDGPMAPRIRELGVRVVPLGMKRGWPSAAALVRLRRELRAFRPRIIQGWMYHGNLVASIGARMVPGTPVAWHILQTLYDPGLERLGTRLAIRAGAPLSRRVAAIVYNAQVSKSQHEAAGYHPRREAVIPNGFDTDAFRPSADARSALRAELSLSPDRQIIGLVNRYHPMKGHDTFLRSARMILDAGANASFVCAGRDVTPSNPVLRELIRDLGLAGRVHLLGERSDTAGLFAGFDVTCCASSWGEGFPNVIGESMACGTPCVVTDVGDGACAVGDTGLVVPPRNPGALCVALLKILSMPVEARRSLGLSARKRVVTGFSLQRYGENFASLYRELLSERSQSVSAR
jgi:glycosyltransferase involved in cell wall biosynthesis